MFNPIASNRYLLPNMYLFEADIANPYFLVRCCQTWTSLDIGPFYEEQCQPSSGSTLAACARNDKLGLHCWGREGLIQFTHGLTDRCDRSTACWRCRLDPSVYDDLT